ncbi:MAG: hypothetical protein WD649_00455, partial [Thermoleophilaceae bacterium]
TDRQTLAVRRTGAVVAGVIVVVLLLFGIRGCLDAREERAFNDYVRDVGNLVGESDQISKGLFKLLSNPGSQSAVDVQNQVNAYRVQSQQLVERAQELEHPDDVTGAQRYLIEALRFRSEGTATIAQQLRTALGDQDRKPAVGRVAGAMRDFLTSDVVYAERFVPALRKALRKEKLPQEIPESKFLPSIDLLRESNVEDQISGILGGRSDEGAAPGLHGTAIEGVTATPGGQALTEGGTTTVPLSSDLALDVQVANQGENDETDIPVRVSIDAGGETIELEETLDEIAQGETKTVSIPISEPPPAGQEATVDIELEPVPAEDMTDNNKASYTINFTKE